MQCNFAVIISMSEFLLVTCHLNSYTCDFSSNVFIVARGDRTGEASEGVSVDRDWTIICWDIELWQSTDQRHGHQAEYDSLDTSHLIKK